MLVGLRPDGCGDRRIFIRAVQRSPRHLADPCMCPAAHLCLFALSSTCICTCVRRRHAYIAMSCNSSRFFTCLRFTYCCRYRWVITVFLHSPSHVELCASSSNGFHVDGLRVTCPVVSAKRTKPMLFRADFSYRYPRTHPLLCIPSTTAPPPKNGSQGKRRWSCSTVS